jgi:uncharacterized membrane protein
MADDIENLNMCMPTNRLETLVDGIFAIAMTLLVFNLYVPMVGGPLSDIAIQQSLTNIYPKFLTFVVSFILLAIFWNLNHKQFNKIKYIDNPFLWINIIWLLFIVMVPFTSSLIGLYQHYTTPHLIFNLNMLGIAFFLNLSWYYATKKKFLTDNFDIKTIITIKTINLSFIIISLLAIVLSFVIPQYCTLLYLLLPFLQVLIEMQNNNK